VHGSILTLDRQRITKWGPQQVSFEIRSAASPERCTLEVRGELDMAVAPQLAEAVATELKAPPPALVLDLTATTFLDSSGARALAIGARDALALGVLVAVLCPPTNRPVRRVMDLLQMGDLVPLVESEADLP
jgi:anti-anti-sigma factor